MVLVRELKHQVVLIIPVVEQVEEGRLEEDPVIPDVEEDLEDGPSPSDRRPLKDKLTLIPGRIIRPIISVPGSVVVQGRITGGECQWDNTDIETCFTQPVYPDG